MGCMVVHQVLRCCQNIKYKVERDGERGLRVRKDPVLQKALSTVLWSLDLTVQTPGGPDSEQWNNVVIFEVQVDCSGGCVADGLDKQDDQLGGYHHVSWEIPSDEQAVGYMSR